MSALLSMIVLSYRNIPGIYESLDSILKQTYDNIEIVISDDATPGFQKEIERIRTYIEEHNSGNIQNVVINAIEVNGGTVKNINSAIRLSHGFYVKVLSAEDELSHENVLQNYVDFMEVSEFDICFGKMRGVTPKGKYVYELLSCESDYDKLKKYTIEETRNRLFKRNFLPAPAWCIKRPLFERYGLFPEDTRLIEDYPYWCYLTEQKVKFGYIDEVMIDYKMSGESSSGIYGEVFMSDMLVIYDRYIFPHDKRFGVFQPIYNTLKRGGLNFYIARARWKSYNKWEKAKAGIKYFPFFCYTKLLDLIVQHKNKKHLEE